MNLNEIKKAVEAGRTVHWASRHYRVVKDQVGQWLIECMSNSTYIRLTWRDGVTMNGREDQFFIAPVEGDTVRYRKPEPGEEGFRFVLLELKDDRCNIQPLYQPVRFAPIECVLVKDIEVVLPEDGFET